MTLSKNAEWKPSAQDAPDIQGIVVSAYPKMLSAMLLMVKFTGQTDASSGGVDDTEQTPALGYRLGPRRLAGNAKRL